MTKSPKSPKSAAGKMSQSTRSAAKSLSLEEVVRETAEKLAHITSKLEKLDKMEQTMEEIKAENRQLRASLTAKDDEIQSLNHRLNDLEQYTRGSSIRVLNVPLTSEEERSNRAVADKLYNLVLLPLLEGAVESGAITDIPTRDQLIEKAHILPGKSGEHKPIIARFYNRELRSVCFQHKKEYASRVQASSTAGRDKERAGSYCFPFYEDLTKANFSMMRTVAAHKDVQSCWSVNGQLRFKLVDSTVVKRVSSIYDTVDNIIRKAK